MTTLKEDKTRSGNGYHCWPFTNPKGANLRCEVALGKGEVTLYKNGRKIDAAYKISSEPGYPTAIHLNTGQMEAKRSHIVQEGDTLLKIAREYGVTILGILDANNLSDEAELLSGQKLSMPDSEWEVWIQELGSGEHSFKVELLLPI